MRISWRLKRPELRLNRRAHGSDIQIQRQRARAHHVKFLTGNNSDANYRPYPQLFEFPIRNLADKRVRSQNSRMLLRYAVPMDSHDMR